MNSTRMSVDTGPPGDNLHHAVATMPSPLRGRSLAVIVKLSGNTSTTLTETVTPSWPNAALPGSTVVSRSSKDDPSTVVPREHHGKATLSSVAMVVGSSVL
jgi:hypothetical protein